MGLDLHVKIGNQVKVGDPIVTLYHNDKGLNEAIKLISESYVIGPEKKEVVLIEDMID